jgi:hypothetical protein
LSKFCGECGNELAQQVLFCGNCGNRVEAFEQPVAEAPYVAPAPTPKAPKPPRKKMGSKAKKVLWSSISGVVAVFVVLTTVSTVNYNNHIHPDYDGEVRHAIADYVDMTALGAIFSESCSDIKTLYATNSQYKTLQKRVDYMNGVSYAPSRKARSRLAANTWYQSWTPPSFSDGMFYYSVNGSLGDAINAEIGKSEKIMASETQEFFSYWEEDIEAAAKKVCNIKSINAKYSALEADYETAKAAAQANADSAPWYPEGYSEWSADSNVAYKWVSGSCDYGTRCSHVRVVTLTGCPTNLYVEANFENDYGTVIDWTNDTASYLGAGDSAYLTLSSYDDNAETTDLTKISCY